MTTPVYMASPGVAPYGGYDYVGGIHANEVRTVATAWIIFWVICICCCFIFPLIGVIIFFVIAASHH